MSPRAAFQKEFEKKIVKAVHALVVLCLLLVAQGIAPAHAAGVTRYVKPGGLDDGGCTRWNIACDFQFALKVVAQPGDQLWVMQGTYAPGVSADATFALRNGIKIYGGFDGTETLLSQRDPAAHVTILSGEIGNLSITTDNVHHVVTSDGVDSTAVLNGFTITAGGNDGVVGGLGYGAGIYNALGSPTLGNLIISHNGAKYYGGGMWSSGGAPTLNRVTFRENGAGNGGGGIYNWASSPVLTNVAFINNSASAYGAGLANASNSSPTLTNVTFSGNMSPYGPGGGMYSSGGAPTLTNVTFSGNFAGTTTTATEGGGIYSTDASAPILRNVTFSGNFAIHGGAMGNQGSSNAKVYNSIFWGDSSEIYNETSAPIIKDTVVAGGCPAGAASCVHVLNADPRLGTLASNGGYTKTIALNPGSAAIDSGGQNSACAATDQRGVTRPQGPACDMGAYEAPITKTFRSAAGQDGWVLEGGETLARGGTLMSTGTLRLGDDAQRRQYRSVLSFNTSAIPDNAVITSVGLKLRYGSVKPAGVDPMPLLQGIMVEVNKGILGSSSSLALADFQAPIQKKTGPFSPAVSGGYLNITPGSEVFPYINKLSTAGGLTQIRLRFKLDDNGDAVANILNLASGDSPTVSYRPALIVQYTLP